MISSFQPSNQNTKLHLPGHSRHSFTTTQQHERQDRKLATSNILFMLFPTMFSTSSMILNVLYLIKYYSQEYLTSMLYVHSNFTLSWGIIKVEWKDGEREKSCLKTVLSKHLFVQALQNDQNESYTHFCVQEKIFYLQNVNFLLVFSAFIRQWTIER